MQTSASPSPADSISAAAYALIDENNLTVTFTLGADFYELHTGMILPDRRRDGQLQDVHPAPDSRAERSLHRR